MKSEPKIIPIASGKGGVGKSFFAANLGIEIANNDFKVIMIDLDLGGSNLYSYLGMQNSNPGLGDYLREKKPLYNYIVNTAYRNLRFLPGEGRETFMANLKYLQKKKLLREISSLEADYIILDLGAGTTFNTLDFFDLADNGIVLSTFEVPAIMNTLTFIKNYLFRKIEFHFKSNTLILDKLKSIIRNSSANKAVTVKQIIEILSEVNLNFAEEVKNILRNFNPRIVFNMVNSEKELDLITKVDHGIVKNLSLSVEYFGYIHFDNEVRRSILNKEVFLDKYEDNIVTSDIRKIAKKIVSD